MHRLDRIVTRTTDALALLGAAGVAIMLVHITAYVVMRLFLSSPIPATVEIVSSYYMVLVAFLPLAWAERRGEMISIEVFAGIMPPPMKRWVAVFVALVTAAAYAVLTYTTWLVALREFGTRAFVISLNVAIPTWPSYFILPAGFALAAFVSLYRALQAVSSPTAPAPAHPDGLAP